MPRLYAQNRISMWQDEDFRALTDGAQNLYNYLLAHQTMTYAGVADWFPKRLAHVNASWTQHRVNELGRELCAGHFIVIDEDTDEVCVRSFMRHEQVLLNPNLVKGATRAIDLIESRNLKRVIVHELWRLKAETPDLAAWQSDEIDFLLDTYEPLDGKQIGAPLSSEDPLPDSPTDPSGRGSDTPSKTPSETPSDRGSRVTSNQYPLTHTPQPVPVNLEPSTASQAGADEDEITARSHLKGLDLDYVEVRKAIVRYCKRQPTPGQVVRAAVHFLAKRDSAPDRPLAYIVGCMKSEWAVVQQQIDEDVDAA